MIKASLHDGPRVVWLARSSADPAVPSRGIQHVQLLGRFQKPFLTAFGDSDPITRGADRFLQAAIPGARGQRHTTLKGAGHFVQEDRGPELARIVGIASSAHGAE